MNKVESRAVNLLNPLRWDVSAKARNPDLTPNRKEVKKSFKHRNCIERLSTKRFWSTVADSLNTNMRHQNWGTQAFSQRVALIDGAENLMAYYEALFTSELDASQDFSMLKVAHWDRLIGQDEDTANSAQN